MSIAYFVSAIAWASFFALVWIALLGYRDHGRGISLGLGLLLFAVLGFLSMAVDSQEEGGDKNES